MSDLLQQEISPGDAPARQQALDTSQSFAVSAPAGSGKTELLIQRSLKLLSQVERPENILAITFTRKAASEMRSRILSALEDAQQCAEVTSQHQKVTRNLALAALKQDSNLGWQLIQNPGRLRIQTIDAFCMQLATQLCMDSGISLPSDIAENPEQSYLNAAEAVLLHMETDSAIGQSVRDLVGYFDANVGLVADLLAKMLATRDSWLSFAVARRQVDKHYVEERLTALVSEVLEDARLALAHHQSDIETLLDYALTNAQENPGSANYLDNKLQESLPDTDPEALPAWRALVRFLTTGSTTKLAFRSARVDVRMGFPKPTDAPDKQLATERKQQFGELMAELKQETDLLVLLSRVAHLPLHDRDSDIGERNQALLEILPVLAAELKIHFQHHNETDYAEIAMTALQALGSEQAPTPLALRLDYRINHILVDEFQDTSNLQVRLLERLTSGWEPEDGRSLFIVGDGMQSIYSFRKANVSLFIRARQIGIGDLQLVPVDLCANFRSDTQIVDWVNTTFSQIFPAHDDLASGRVAFRKAFSARSSSDWPIHLLGAESAESEADLLALDVQKKLEKTADTLAILVRGRSHLQAILPALRARNIEWQAQDIDALYTRQAVLDIHCLARALLMPADRIAWLALLRAPWAGLDNADLVALCRWRDEAINQCHATDDTNHSIASNLNNQFPALWRAICAARSIKELSAAGLSTLLRVRLAFERGFSNIGKLSLRDTLEKLWHDLDGQEGLFTANDGQDVQDYLAHIETRQSGGMIMDWPAFERSLGKLFAKPISNSKSARLQIMTIHKSKGLEFDHVYLPSLGKRARGDQHPILQWWEREYADGSSGYLFSSKPASGDEDDLYSYLNFEKKLRDEQETARLLYVASTRAKKSLWLSAALRIDSENRKIRNPEASSLLNILWPLYENLFSDSLTHNLSQLEPPPTIDKPRTLGFIRRLDPNRELPPSLELATSDKIATAELPDFSTNYRQRAKGTLIHETLMTIVQEPEIEPSAGRFVANWTATLSAMGFSANDRGEIIEELTELLERMLADKTGQWLLDANHQDSQAELELDYLDSNGKIQRAVIDRTFVDNSVRWIVDYKSSYPNENENPQDFMEREAEKYRPQLQRYAGLFENDLPIRGLLYFPALGASIGVE